MGQVGLTDVRDVVVDRGEHDVGYDALELGGVAARQVILLDRELDGAGLFLGGRAIEVVAWCARTVSSAAAVSRALRIAELDATAS